MNRVNAIKKNIKKNRILNVDFSFPIEIIPSYKRYPAIPPIIKNHKTKHTYDEQLSSMNFLNS